jgi:hypothetical protein
MKKMIVIGTFALGLVALTARSEKLETQYIRSIRMGACDFWSYSNEARGYVCSSYPSSVSVADSYSVEEENRDLRAQIDALEKRIEVLEKRPN